MKLLILLAFVLLVGCVIALPPQPPLNTANAYSIPQIKPSGPDVKTLRNDQISAIESECIKYGNIADTRVYYNVLYCSQVGNERNYRSLHAQALPRTVMKGWTFTK